MTNMQTPYSTCYESSQEDDFDEASFIAAVDAILRAPAAPRVLADDLAAVERMLGHVARQFGIAFPANDEAAASLKAELEELAETFDDMTPAIILRGARVRVLVKKHPARRPRKSGLRDLKDVRRARAYRGSLGEVQRAKKAGPMHHHPSSTSKTSTPLSKTSSHDNDNRGTASWDDTGEAVRILYVNEAVARFGAPYAFSLNLGPEVIDAASRHPRGALDYLRRRIARELLKALGRQPEFWMILETTADGKLHVHGAVAVDHNDDLLAVKAALTRAGGRWTSKGTDYQTDIAPTRYRDTWASYSVKRLARTRRHLRALAGLGADAKVALLSSTDNLRAEAKRLHQAERRLINAA